MYHRHKGSETDIIIPERIGKRFDTSIDSSAFRVSCELRFAKYNEILNKIKTVTIGSNVKSIGMSAFYN